MDATKAKDHDPRYFVESAARSMDLLMFMARTGQPVSLGDLVEGLGWTKPMVYRLIRTLEMQSGVRKAGRDGYILGPAIVELGQAALRSMSLIPVAHPHMEELNQRHTISSVNLAVLDGHEVLYIHHVEGQHLVVVRVGVGTRLPAHLTSMGQVLLAAHSDEEVREIVADADFSAGGPQAVRSADELIYRLDEVRRRGYCLSDAELSAGVRAVAVPLRDYSGEVIAGVNASVPPASMTLDEIRRTIVPDVISTGERISADLAHPIANGKGK